MTKNHMIKIWKNDMRDGATLASDCDPWLNIQLVILSRKRHNVNRKKPSVHVWSVCEGLAIIHEESKLRSTNKQLYGYISIVYFDENLTSSCNLFYGMCTRDRPQGIWDFPVVI